MPSLVQHGASWLNQVWNGSLLSELPVLHPVDYFHLMFLRSFSRDSKAVIEREHALRLLRTVMTLPAERPRLTCRISSRDSPSRRSSPLSPRKRSMIDTDLNPTDILLAKRVSLTGGMIRAIVSVAENPDDALRTVCMETLIEIGES